MSNTIPYTSALIVGAGPGISASLARLLGAAGLKVGLVARDTAKLEALASETGAERFSADAANPADMERVFGEADERIGQPDIVVYNASRRVRGPLAELDPGAVQVALNVTAFGAFLTVQQAARRMVPQGRGAILLTGATAGLKGFSHSAAFAMGKFALRGLAMGGV